MPRLGLAAFLVVLATLLVPIGVTAGWLSLRVDSTEAYVDTVAPLADDPDLRDALATEVSDAAVGILEERVPAALLPDGLRAVVRASAQEVVENDGFPEFWRKANAKTHREFLAIVHEDDPDLVAQGWVYLDVGPLLDAVLADMVGPLPGSIDLPPQTLLVPVLPESRLEQGRGAYLVLDWLSLWVPVIWLALLVVAVVVAPGWRGRLRVAAAAAIGAALGGVLVLLIASPATDLAVDQVDPDNQDLARLVIEVVVGSLGDAAMTVVIGGAVVGAALLVGSFLPGRSRRAAAY